MPLPNFYITEANYHQLIGAGYWTILDVPPARWANIARHFGGIDTLGVFASGSAPHKIDPANKPAPIGGIDWMRLERNPVQGEPPVNVYHYVIGQSGQGGFPVFGPYRYGAIADHWMDDLDQITRYYPQD